MDENALRFSFKRKQTLYEHAGIVAPGGKSVDYHDLSVPETSHTITFMPLKFNVEKK